MTSSDAQSPQMVEQPRTWVSIPGEHTILYIAAGSALLDGANGLLRASDSIVSALQKLLAPDSDRAGAALRIYFTDDPSVPDDADISICPPNSDSHYALVKSITTRLVERWFGPRALLAGTIMAGLIGVVSANAGIGESLEAASDSVRLDLRSGSHISIANQNSERLASLMESPCPPESMDPAATSFVGFLISNFGAARLRSYLSAYDPNRHDQAAISVFHQPLAVLEEEWMAWLQRRGNQKGAVQSFLRQILPLLRPYKWKQLEILVYLLLAAAYNVVQPYAIKTVINRLSSQQNQGGIPSDVSSLFVHRLMPFLLLLLVIYVVNGVVSLRRAYTVNWLNQTVLNTLQVRMYAHLHRLAHNFHIKAKIGDLMARIDDDLDNVQSALSQITNKALYQSFTLIGALMALIMLTHQSPALSIPILCVIPLFAVNYMALRTRNKQASREQRRRAAQAMVTVQQTLAAHALIKAFGMEQRTIDEYKSRVRSLQRSKLRLAMLSAITDLSEDATTAIAQLIIFGVGGYLVLRDGPGALGVGEIAALLVLVKSIFGPIASLAGVGQTMQQATGAMERVSELFEEPITICDLPGATPLPLLSREIRFDHVSFCYGGDRQALRDVDIVIPAGKHVALVGPSGSGKSSMVNLLLRFWDPEEGKILFDGRDLRSATLESLRGQIGLVFQETFIFDTTIRENIALGRSDATDAEVIAAARAAQLHTFIESLPAGYDTIPGENGATLSVGQKQRIAIARAFLRNPRILILDEATSALDAHTEAGVLETLAELAKGRTTISVTHRISQSAVADLILVFEAGRLVEHGSHAELRRAGGLYQRLYEEASGFVADVEHPAHSVAEAA